MSLFKKKKKLIELPPGVAPTIVDAKFRGCRYRMPDHWVITRQLLRGIDYEPWVLDDFLSLCKPGARVLDIGGGWGAFALPAAKAVGAGGRVTTVEMMPSNAKVILESAKANGIENLDLLLIGVSDSLGVARIRKQTSASNNAVEPPSDAAPDSLDDFDLAPLIPLDALRGEIGKVDVLKIDIEGMEYRALKGAAALLAENRPMVFLEYSPEFQDHVSGAPPGALLGLFIGLGYDIDILHRKAKRERVTGDDPIAAVDAAWRRHVDEDQGTHLDLRLVPKG